MRFWASLGALLLLSTSCPRSALATPGAPVWDSNAALAPAELAPHRSAFFSLGMGSELASSQRGQDEYFGLAGVFRYRSWGPNLALLVSPSAKGIEDWGGRVTGGVRSYFELGGMEFSYGVHATLGARIDSHYWLAHASPLELGSVLYRENSWYLELFVGARRAFAGALVNSFLFDPNGFDNEDAQDELDAIRFERPWQGFVRLVFGRRLYR
jgi:hypothetical protein